MGELLIVVEGGGAVGVLRGARLVLADEEGAIVEVGIVPDLVASVLEAEGGEGHVRVDVVGVHNPLVGAVRIETEYVVREKLVACAGRPVRVESHLSSRLELLLYVKGRECRKRGAQGMARDDEPSGRMLSLILGGS